MALIDDLNAKVDALQASLDNEQAQVANAINALNETVAGLQAQLADGATPEQVQALIDKIGAITTDLEGTIADAPTETPTDEPGV